MNKHNTWLGCLRAALVFGISLYALSGCANYPSEPPTLGVPEPHASEGYPGLYSYAYFRSTDGLRLFGQMWQPEGTPKAVFVFLHGSVLHSDDYRKELEYIAGKGYVVYAMDMRGWGRSEGNGRRGGSYSLYNNVNDLSLVVQKMRKQFPGKKLFIGGESLGATVALLGTTMGLVHCDGLVLSSPAVRADPRVLGMTTPHFLLPMEEWAGRIVYHFAPNAPILPPWLGLVTRDPKVLQDLKDDPLVVHRWLPQSYVGSFMDAITDINRNADDLKTPFLIVAGDHDNLIPLWAMKDFYKWAGSTDKTAYVYKGAYHLLLLDPDRQQVLGDIVHWLNDHLKDKPKASETASAE